MSKYTTLTTSPLVSCILPVKNEERLLAAAIDNVLAQDYEPLELIVVDDHSDDRTGEIARNVDGVRYVLTDGNGLGSAWNTGVKVANGSLITFQAADDRWTPGKLGIQTQYLLEHPEIDYCIGKTRYSIEPGKTPQAGFRRELLDEDVQLILMEASMVRRTAFDRVGYFDKTITTAQEVDWCARANDAGLRLGRIDELVLFKSIHESNMTFDPALARENNQNLMSILRDSVQRKQKSQK